MLESSFRIFLWSNVIDKTVLLYYCVNTIIDKGVNRMAWKFDNDRSIYIQLVEQIQNRIITGEYPPGSKLASVRDLAAEAEVNPNTMQKALTALENMGLVHAVRTSGRFVTEDLEMIKELKYQSAADVVAEFKQKMKSLGFCEKEIVELVTTGKQDVRREWHNDQMRRID